MRYQRTPWQDRRYDRREATYGVAEPGVVPPEPVGLTHTWRRLWQEVMRTWRHGDRTYKLIEEGWVI